MVLDICSYIISGKLILILFFSSKLVFLPICIVEMYVIENRSQGRVKKKPSTLTVNSDCFLFLT